MSVLVWLPNTHSLTHSETRTARQPARKHSGICFVAENRFEFEFERYTLWVCSALLTLLLCLRALGLAEILIVSALSYQNKVNIRLKATV